jgi:predicted nucleotidyltransferase
MITVGRARDPAATLFGKARREILGLLFGRPGEAFYLRQIVRATGLGLGPAQRELKKLTEASLILRAEKGRQVFFRANPATPVFAELKDLLARLKEIPAPAKEPDRVASLIARHFGATGRGLAGFCRKHKIKRLSFFGSVLRKDFKRDSDIDVLVEFETGKTPGFLRLADIEAELSGLLGGEKIEMRTPQDLSPHFRDRIIHEARVQYAADR